MEITSDYQGNKYVLTSTSLYNMHSFSPACVYYFNYLTYIHNIAVQKQDNILQISTITS